MDQLKSLLGVYDPNIDKLAQEFRSRVSQNVGALNDVIKNSNEVKNVVSKIPGVSEETKKQLNSALEKAKSFTGDAYKMTPDQIAAQKDKLQLLVRTAVNKAQEEAKKLKIQKTQEKKVALKEKKENEVFSPMRLARRMWDTGKFYLLIAIGIGLALWGGSMASNAAIDKPVSIRFFYFIYGTILFPLSFAFALYRSMTGVQGSYHAMLAPLIAEPVYSQTARYLLFPFIYMPSGVVLPLPVEPNPAPTYNSESAVMIQAVGNEAISQIGTQV